MPGTSEKKTTLNTLSRHFHTIPTAKPHRPSCDDIEISRSQHESLVEGGQLNSGS